jgi:ribosomal protein S19
MIDVAIPTDRNVTQEEAEKKLKYVQMWNNKCMIIPVIIGATGIVTKGLKKSLEAISEKKRTFSRFI